MKQAVQNLFRRTFRSSSTTNNNNTNSSSSSNFSYRPNTRYHSSNSSMEDQEQQEQQQQQGVQQTHPRSSTLLIGFGGSSSYKELWTETAESSNVIALGVDPTNSQRLSNFRTEYDISSFEARYPQYPIVLDHLQMNQKLVDLNIVKVASGSIHTLYLTDIGTCYSMGYNSDYELALHHNNNTTVPMLVTWFIDQNIRIKDIACGGWYSAWISTTDDLYILGRIGEKTKTHPYKIASNVVRMGCGNEFIVYQTADNKVYAMGESSTWNAGMNLTTATPTELQYRKDSRPKNFDFRAKKIDGGEKFCIIQSEAGDIYITGNVASNDQGSTTTYEGFTYNAQLSERRIQDFSCSWSSVCFLDFAGHMFTLAKFCQDEKQVTPTAHLTKMPLICAGAGFFLMVAQDTLAVFRMNSDGVSLDAITSTVKYDTTGFEVACVTAGYFVGVIVLHRSRNLTQFYTKLLNQCSSTSPFADVEVITMH